MDNECLKCDRCAICEFSINLEIHRLETLKILVNSFNVAEARYAIEDMLAHKRQTLENLKGQNESCNR